MEPVGLAVGVLGLAGLFSTCLEAVERFDSWNNFTDEKSTLGTHLEAEKLRFKRWGHAVGLDKGAISPDLHEAFDDPQILSTVRKHLSIIETLCGGTDGTLPSAAGDARRAPLLGRLQAPAAQDSRRQRIKWALRDKAKYTAQVETIGRLVQDLYNLVPPDGTKGALPAQWATWNGSQKQTDDAITGPWAVDLGRILAGIQKELEAETRKDLHAWLLGPHTPNELYDDAIHDRQDGTCDWFLERPAFVDWLSSDFPAGSAKGLWVNGPAGFGKTMLCARIVEHLRSVCDPPPAYFFFSSDFESRRDPFVAIRSWLSQLLSHPVAFELVRDGYEAQPDQVARRVDIVQLLRKVAQALPECTFVLDGLDECTGVGQNLDIDHDNVPKFLETIQRAIAETSTRLWIVSRDEPGIRQSILQKPGIATAEYKISSQDVQSDIEVFSRSIVDKKLPNKGETLKDEISQKLAGRCNGQFLWVKMQGPSLRSGKNKKQLEAVIEGTPTGLDRLYDRNWERIVALPEEERTRAVSLLRWAAFALRPLTVSEITEALLISHDGEEFSVDELPDSIDQDYVESEILGLCGSLVEVRGAASERVGLRTVHLAHFSVKQFFFHPRGQRAPTKLTRSRPE